jgi:hypothetical protein
VSRFFFDSRTARATGTILAILGVVGLAWAISSSTPRTA